MAETSRAIRGKRAKVGARAAGAAELLAWYEVSARVLPWRARGGAVADPYRVWLSEIMLQQTQVRTVLPYFAKFAARWPNVEALAAAKLQEVLSAWAGLGYYARARNLHACAKAVAAEHGGEFPDKESALRRLPGIGAYTSAAIAAIAFGKKATPVDGNIERVMARLFAVGEQLPAAKKTLARLAAELTPAHRAGDFAQAMMDLGATICTPRKPACAICPWMEPCVARLRGDQETFPRKTEKTEGKLRRGAAFVVLREDGCILLRTRPERGLLGGMTEVPTTEWNTEFLERDALKFAPLFSPLPIGEREIVLPWEKLPGTVRHVFTHFPLELSVYRTNIPVKTRAPRGLRFVPLSALDNEALPTLMRKVIAHAIGEPKPKTKIQRSKK